MACLHRETLGAEPCQRRAEEEERDAVLDVELAYLREDGERRIVHDHLAAAVIELLVVASRIERSHYLRWVDVVFGASPVLYDLVDLWRRVAVIGCLLRLELLLEGKALFGVLGHGG